MNWSWSPSTKGFFLEAIHGAEIPQDAVAISAEEHDALLAGQAAGKRIGLGVDGRPELQDPPPPSSESLAAGARARRDGLIRASDWTESGGAQSRLGEAKAQAWAAYRQALFDLPEQPGFPTTIIWPEAPV